MIEDIFGKELEVGDAIYYYDSGYRRIMVGTIKKITNLSVIAYPRVDINQPISGKAVIPHSLVKERIIKYENKQ